MKRTSKKILGILALMAVAVVTMLAAFMPTPDTSALDTPPITDQVTVRVVGAAPKVTIVSPENDTIYVEPNQILNFEFEGIGTTDTVLYYTDADGIEQAFTIDTIDPDYNPGDSGDIDLDLSAEPYGYGDYRISVTGTGLDDVTDEDTVEFSYVPVYGRVSEDPDDGLIYLDLFYDDENEDISYIMVNVYDGNSMVSALTAKVKPGTNRIELPFAKNELASGNYSVEITAYGEDDEPLYLPYPTTAEYTATPLPDTGAFFRGMNIAQSDLIITGVVVFVAIAVVASVLIVHNKKQQRN